MEEAGAAEVEKEDGIALVDDEFPGHSGLMPVHAVALIGDKVYVQRKWYNDWKKENQAPLQKVLTQKSNISLQNVTYWHSVWIKKEEKGYQMVSDDSNLLGLNIFWSRLSLKSQFIWTILFNFMVSVMVLCFYFLLSRLIDLFFSELDMLSRLMASLFSTFLMAKLLYEWLIKVAFVMLVNSNLLNFYWDSKDFLSDWYRGIVREKLKKRIIEILNETWFNLSKSSPLNIMHEDKWKLSILKEWLETDQLKKYFEIPDLMSYRKLVRDLEEIINNEGKKREIFFKEFPMLKDIELEKVEVWSELYIPELM